MDFPTERKTALTAAILFLAMSLTLTLHAQDAAASNKLEADIQKARADLTQTRKEIAKADFELGKTDSLLREESTRATQSEERQSKDRERREKENQDLQKRLLDTQAKIDAERAQQGRHQNTVEEIKARQKNLAMTLAGYCDSLATRINEGLPWDKEARLDRVNSLRKDLESGGASVDEGFARLNSAIKEEIKSGDEIALLNKPMTRKNGDLINAQVLKVGNQWLVYMDEEGKLFGILERKNPSTAQGKPNWEWREDLSFSEKNQIRTAIEVKSAKKPPQLVVLTLGAALAPSTSEKGSK